MPLLLPELLALLLKLVDLREQFLERLLQRVAPSYEDQLILELRTIAGSAALGARGSGRDKEAGAARKSPASCPAPLPCIS